MAILSSAAFWGIPLGVIAVASCYYGGFRARAFVVISLLAFGLTDGVIGRTVKSVVGRPRPHQSEAGVRTIDLASPAWRGLFAPVKEKLSTGDGRGKPGKSFPSNHSANTAAVAMVAALIWRRWGWLAFIPALGVSYSRVYTGAHWPTDTLAGICIGVGAALLMMAVAEWAWRRWSHRWAPRVAAMHPSILTA